MVGLRSAYPHMADSWASLTRSSPHKRGAGEGQSGTPTLQTGSGTAAGNSPGGSKKQQQQRVVKRVKRRGSNDEVRSRLADNSTREVAREEPAEAERAVTGERSANGDVPVHANRPPNDYPATGISDRDVPEARELTSDGGDVQRGHAEGSPAGGTARGAAVSAPLRAVRAPIDELLHWHTGIRQELSAFEADLKGLSQRPGSVACLLKRCRFLADMCAFHR